MHKEELVRQVAKKAVITQAIAEKVINAMTESITSSLQKGEGVRLMGFGSFVLQERKATTGRNPRTGVVIQIPAKRLVKFSPGKELKEAVALGSTEIS
jgi:DNA-binding protein HU-beta